MVCPVWCQAITNTNDDLKLIGLLGTSFNEILIKTRKKYSKENGIWFTIEILFHLHVLSVAPRP